MRIFTSFCLFVLTLAFATQASAQPQDPSRDYEPIPLLGDDRSTAATPDKPSEPPKPPAKAIGTGPWADGLMHVQYGTQVGRGCLDVDDVEVKDGKFAYSCFSPSDRRWHVVLGTEIDAQGYSRISDLKFADDGKLNYTGYEGLQICSVQFGQEAKCHSKRPSIGFQIGDDEELTASRDRLSIGGSAYPEPVPALPRSLTGGKKVTEYWIVNQQPLWKDCNQDSCTMRWNGQTAGKTYPGIEAVAVNDNKTKAAYVARLSERGQSNRRYVVANKHEGEAFAFIYDLQFLGNDFVYRSVGLRGLAYKVIGTRKEAFRDISHFEVVGDKLLLVGRKDPTPSRSPI